MSEIYRDRSEGAAARRQELLRRRRDELVTMPHAVRRVVVARTARIAAAIAVVVFGTAMLAAIASPSLAHAFGGMLPGFPAPLSTLLCATWVAGIAAYLVSRARAEHRFAVAMSRYVLPGNDVDLDIERLDHEHPDVMAKQTAHRSEIGSAAWPVLATAIVVPVTAMYVAFIVRAHGWPVMSEFELSLAQHARVFVTIALAGVVATLVMTRRFARRPDIALAAATITLVTIALGIVSRYVDHGATTTLLGMATLAAPFAWIARRLRIERGLIDAVDPAAGSELFTLRDVVRAIRAMVVRTRAVTMRFGAVGLAVAAICVLTKPAPKHVETAMVIGPTPAQNPAPIATPTHSDEPRVYLRHFPDHFEFEISGTAGLPHVANLTEVPAGWHAHFEIDVAGDATPVSIDFAHQPHVTLFAGDHHVFDLDACGYPSKAIGWTVSAEHARLSIRPTLSLSACNVE